LPTGPCHLIAVELLLHGTSATNLNKLQVSQNKLARAMCQTLQSVSATEENYAIAINPPTKNAK